MCGENERVVENTTRDKIEGGPKTQGHLADVDRVQEQTGVADDALRLGVPQ